MLIMCSSAARQHATARRQFKQHDAEVVNKTSPSRRDEGKSAHSFTDIAELRTFSALHDNATLRKFVGPEGTCARRRIHSPTGGRQCPYGVVERESSPDGAWGTPERTCLC